MLTTEKKGLACTAYCGQAQGSHDVSIEYLTQNYQWQSFEPQQS